MIDWLNTLLKRKKTCPDKDTIIKAFLNEISLDEKFRLLDHVSSCSRCRISFIAVKDVWSRSREMLGNLEAFQEIDATRQSFRNLVRQELRNLKGRSQTKKKLLARWRKIPVAVAALGLIVFGIIYLSRSPRETGVERKTFPWQIELLQPKGEVEKAALVFSWTPLKEARRYRLEIFDKELELLYASDPISGNEFALPGRIFLRLKKSEIYFWKVTAFLGPNQEIESDFSKFRIKKD